MSFDRHQKSPAQGPFTRHSLSWSRFSGSEKALSSHFIRDALGNHTTTPTCPSNVTSGGAEVLNPRRLRSGIDSGYGSIETNPDPIGVDSSKLEFVSREVPVALQNRFQDIKLLLADPLLDAISSKRGAPTRGVSMKLRWTTSNASDSRPTIVVQCESDKAVKKAKKFFAQTHIKEILGHDFVIHIASGLRRLCTEALSVCADDEHRATYCGMALRIETAEGPRLATFGGLVEISQGAETSLYGLTAGHPLAKVARPGHDTIFRMEDVDDDSDSSSSYSSDECMSPFETDSDDGDRLEFCDATLSGSLQQIGEISHHSFQLDSGSANLDWALIRLSEGRQLPNLLSLSESDKTKSVPLVTTSGGCCFESPLPTVVLTSRGAQKGILMNTSSCLLVAPGREFVETFDFVPNEASRLQTGDSGSLVVCEATGRVFGHLVSIDAFGEAYIMPLDATFEHIKWQMQADEVRLPLLEKTFQGYSWPLMIEPECIPIRNGKPTDLHGFTTASTMVETSEEDKVDQSRSVGYDAIGNDDFSAQNRGQAEVISHVSHLSVDSGYCSVSEYPVGDHSLPAARLLAKLNENRWYNAINAVETASPLAEKASSCEDVNEDVFQHSCTATSLTKLDSTRDTRMTARQEFTYDEDAERKTHPPMLRRWMQETDSRDDEGDVSLQVKVSSRGVDNEDAAQLWRTMRYW